MPDPIDLLAYAVVFIVWASGFAIVAFTYYAFIR